MYAPLSLNAPSATLAMLFLRGILLSLKALNEYFRRAQNMIAT